MKKLYSTQDRSLASLVKAMRIGRHRYLLTHGLGDSLLLLAIIVGMPVIYGESLSLMYVILAVVLLTSASFLVVNWEWNRKAREATRLGIIGLDMLPEPSVSGEDVGASELRERDSYQESPN